LRKRFRVKTDFQILAEDGNIFAEVEARAKLGDSGLALLYSCDGRWREEPRRKGIFAHPRAGQRKKFEQAIRTEEIQVGGVEAAVDLHTLTCLAGASPAIFDARQPLAIDIDGSLRTRPQAQDLRVEDSQRNEEKDGKK
jgi:hypothetical protein